MVGASPFLEQEADGNARGQEALQARAKLVAEAFRLAVPLLVAPLATWLQINPSNQLFGIKTFAKSFGAGGWAF